MEKPDIKRGLCVCLAIFAPIYTCMWLAIGAKAIMCATVITIAVFAWVYVVMKAFYGKDL